MVDTAPTVFHWKRNYGENSADHLFNHVMYFNSYN